MNHKLNIRQMRREELDTLVDWAAAEGWNPGVHDADTFWASDPDGYIAAELDGELIGGGSIVSYQGDFGFMGFFIIRPEFRGQGLGTQLWFARRDMLREKLRTKAAIGMDGVFEMQPFYTRGGFVFSHREIRFEGRAKAGRVDPHITDLNKVSFDELCAYDKQHFPAERTAFIKPWIDQPESLALAYMLNDKLAGYGVIRRCRTGYKIGPLFADSATIAEALFNGLANHVGESTVYLDVPEINDDAMTLVKQHNMHEVFACARMYFGPKPGIKNANIYGVTTFELG